MFNFFLVIIPTSIENVREVALVFSKSSEADLWETVQIVGFGNVLRSYIKLAVVTLT